MTVAPDTSQASPTVLDKARERFTPASFTIGIMIVLAIIVMWPAKFGGHSTVVIVSGNSMQPTYDTGDIVFTWSTPEVEVGQVVVFAVPEGQAGEGGLVLHRVVGLDDDVIITQGDNNSFKDPWVATSNDVLGSARISIPYVGHLFFLLGSPFAIAGLLGLAAVINFWPRRDAECDDDEVAATQISG